MAQRYHVFSLPPELLETLTPRNLLSRTLPQDPSPSPMPLAPNNARACNICLGTTFVDVDEQRSHFRSDWHRYNVKIRLQGGSPVTESAFANLVDGLEDSLSGSASSDESSDDSDAVKALVSKIKRTSRSPSPSEQRQMPMTAIIWFHSPPSTQIGAYRMLFPLDTPATSYLAELKSMQERVEGGRKWAMFMVAGGHFAGAVVQVSRPAEEQDLQGSAKAKKKPPKPKLETLILKHKTFHRYTTRRKQGGSQSVNDNSKGTAISAGATLRRYGEQALRDDIRNLLQDWADDIQDCERIWLRASVSNKRIFLDYEGCIINKGDDRLRTFPFPTRRPTQSELARCLLELTQVKTSHLTEEEIRAQDEAFLASLPKPKATPSAVPPPEKTKPQRLTKEEEAYREKWSRLLDMISKGRSEPLKSFWEREGVSLGGVDVLIPEWTGDRRASLLQVAAQSGQEDVARWLLYELRADPSIPVPSSGGRQEDEVANESDVSDAPPSRGAGPRRTAYDLASTRAVRDVFRRCVGDHPDWWDWFGAAHVPSAFSKEKEEARDEKKRQRKKGLKEKMREREAREKEREGRRSDIEDEQIETKPEPRPGPRDSMAPRKLGGLSGAADSVMGLTPEMRAKVERERRARAAEARLKTLTTSSVRQ